MNHAAATTCVLCQTFADGLGLEPDAHGRVWPWPHELDLVRAVASWPAARRLVDLMAEGEISGQVESGVCRFVLEVCRSTTGRDAQEVELVCGLEGSCLACRRLRVGPALADLGDPRRWDWMTEAEALAAVHRFVRYTAGPGPVIEAGVAALKWAAGRIRGGETVGAMRADLDAMLGLLETA